MLEQNEDFSLSESDLSKYNSANLVVTEYIREQFIKVDFYFFSRKKHIKLKNKIIPWSYVPFQLLLFLLSVAALILTGLWAFYQTDKNGIVLLLLVVIFSICLGDIKQIDTPYLSETTSGLTFAVDRLKHWEHSGHMTLAKGERSRIADFAAENL